MDEDAGCQNRINVSRADIEAKGMKIAVLDNALEREISTKPTVRPGGEYRNGIQGSFPFCFIYTRFVGPYSSCSNTP